MEWQAATDAGFTTNIRSWVVGESWTIANTTSTTPRTSTQQYWDTAFFTGTWYIRARTIDYFGRVGPWSTGQSFTISHPPVSTNTGPLGETSVFYGAGTITFSWGVTDPSPYDTASAYQIIVERDSDGTLVYDTGKVVSANWQAALALSATYKETRLRWKIRSWDNDDAVGAYSAYSYFYMIDSPVVTVTAPTDGAVLTTANPTVSWSATFGGGRTQKAYNVTLKKGAATIWTSGWIVNSSTAAITIPSGYLLNSTSYSIQVQVKDTADLEGFAQVGVSTSWTPPATPTFSVSNSNYATLGFHRVTWTNAVIDANFSSYRVYRKKFGEADSTYVLLNEQYLNLSNYTFDDYTAGSSETYTYKVTQTTNFFGSIVESGYNTANVTGSSPYYWLIHPTNSALNMILPQVKDDPFTHEYEEETFTIIGRGRHKDIGDYLGHSGTLTAQLRDTAGGTTARQKRQALEALKNEKVYLYLRNPFGDVWQVAAGNLSFTRISGVGTAEFTDVTIPYAETGY
jgi:hypothetical protein